MQGSTSAGQFVFEQRAAEPVPSVLYDEHVKLTGKSHIAAFAGYLMPLWYSSIAEEHRAVRERAGLFDCTHMGVLEVRGRRRRELPGDRQHEQGPGSEDRPGPVRLYPRRCRQRARRHHHLPPGRDQLHGRRQRVQRAQDQVLSARVAGGPGRCRTPSDPRGRQVARAAGRMSGTCGTRTGRRIGGWTSPCRDRRPFDTLAKLTDDAAW